MNEYSYILEKKLKPADDLLLLELKPSNGEVFAYNPGQYVMISFRNSHGVMEEKHTFSLASSPTQKGLIQLGIRIGGRFTRELADLPEGEKVVVYGPFGSFSFNEHKHNDAVFFAGGIGITPFMSAMRYATDKQLPNKLSLICSNRTLEGSTFLDEIQSLAEHNPNIRSMFCVTDDKSKRPRKGVQYDRITPQVIKDAIVSPDGKTFFLCGPLPFMTAMRRNLLEFGASEEQILMEEFAMLTNSTLAQRFAYAGNIIGWSAMAMLLPFYLVYAANTKTISGEPILDKLFKDKDNQDAENQQTVLGEIQEHLPLAVDKPATSSDQAAAKGQTGSVAGTENRASVQTIQKSVQPKTTTQASKAGQASNAAAKPSTAVAAPKPETGASTAANTNQAQTNTANTAPAPTTGASGVTTGTQPSAGQTTAAPAPTTGASGAAAPGNTAPAGTPTNGGTIYEDDD
jgi:ferredoxin-NADP reductase